MWMTQKLPGVTGEQPLAIPVQLSGARPAPPALPKTGATLVHVIAEVFVTVTSPIPLVRFTLTEPKSREAGLRLAGFAASAMCGAAVN